MATLIEPSRADEMRAHITKDHATKLASEEEHVLRCLGAAVMMQWNALPANLQRELFDNAGSMGELLSTEELRGQIARFLHNHNKS